MGNEMFNFTLEVISIAFFAGIYVATVRFNKELIERIEKSFEDKFSELKENFYERMDTIESKQDRHNSIIERTYCIERDLSVVKEQNKVQNHRLDDLEHRYEHIG